MYFWCPFLCIFHVMDIEQLDEWKKPCGVLFMDIIVRCLQASITETQCGLQPIPISLCQVKDMSKPCKLGIKPKRGENIKYVILSYFHSLPHGSLWGAFYNVPCSIQTTPQWYSCKTGYQFLLDGKVISFVLSCSSSFLIMTYLYKSLVMRKGSSGFRPRPTQTRLYSHRRWLEA